MLNEEAHVEDFNSASRIFVRSSVNLFERISSFRKDRFIIPPRPQWAHVFPMGVERFLRAPFQESIHMDTHTNARNVPARR